MDIYLNDQNKWKTAGDFLNGYNQSRKNIYLLLNKRQLLLDDQPVKNVQQPLNGTVLSLILEPQEVDWINGKKECQVLYEDDFIYIVHKPPGLIIHNHEDPKNCLNAEAALYQRNHGIHAPVRPIHRLDKETTGLLLYCKIPFFQPWFDSQLAEKKISRKYLAIVNGKVKNNEKFTIHAPIGKDRHVSNKYRISLTGKDALTHFQGVSQKGRYALIRCVLETGRTHQIRVHLASRGLPIVNDKLYGKPSSDFKHMGLWAYEIEFAQPITGKRYKVKDVVNSDFEYFGEVNEYEI